MEKMKMKMNQEGLEVLMLFKHDNGINPSLTVHPISLVKEVDHNTKQEYYFINIRQALVIQEEQSNGKRKNL